MLMRTMFDRRFFAPEGGAGAGNGAAGAQGGAGGVENGGSAGAQGGVETGFDWSKAPGIDADGLGFVQNKGWKAPGDLLGSYRNLEKLVGAPPESIIKLPQDGKPESWDPIHSKLGWPEKPDGYVLPVPEGGDKEFAAEAAKWFHDARIPKAAAEALAAKWNEHAAGVMTKATEQAKARDTEQMQNLKVDWGQAYDSNAAIVDRAATEFGMTKDDLDALKHVMGAGKAMRFLHSIGSKLGTGDNFISADGKVTVTGMSPEAAKARITALRNDKEFVARYSAGGAKEKEEMANLHKIAYPS